MKFNWIGFGYFISCCFVAVGMGYLAYIYFKKGEVAKSSLCCSFCSLLFVYGSYVWRHNIL